MNKFPFHSFRSLEPSRTVWLGDRLLAFLVVSAAIRGILMLSRKNQRQKLKREQWRFSFARVAAGTILDSIWDFPSQTDMVLLTFAEAILAVCVDMIAMGVGWS